VNKRGSVHVSEVAPKEVVQLASASFSSALVGARTGGDLDSQLLKIFLLAAFLRDSRKSADPLAELRLREG
jgi:hypothetical protein